MSNGMMWAQIAGDAQERGFRRQGMPTGFSGLGETDLTSTIDDYFFPDLFPDPTPSTVPGGTIPTVYITVPPNTPPPSTGPSGLQSILATIMKGLDAFSASKGFASQTYRPATPATQQPTYTRDAAGNLVLAPNPNSTLGSQASNTIGNFWNGIASQFGISPSTLTILAAAGIFLFLKTPGKR